MPVTLIDSSPLRFNDGDAIYFGNDIVNAGSYAKIGLNSARFDIDLPSSGLRILPYQNDAGVFQIGDGTTDMDVKIFLGDASHYVLFDVGLQRLIIYGCDVDLSGDLTVTLEDISLAQGKYLYFEGQDSATYIRAANAGYLDLDAATAIRLGADLFLESGGVISFDSGNFTITHSTGLLTFSAALTVSGTTIFSDDVDVADGKKITFRAATEHIISDAVSEIMVTAASVVNLAIGGTDELTVSATQVLIPTNDLLVQAGSLTVTHATLGADERLARFLGTVATPAMTDGYGAVEVDLSVTGAISGAAFAASAWINLGASVTVSGGQNIGPHTDGIYIDNAANLSSAILALCGRFSLIAGTNTTWDTAHLFDLNLDIDKDLTSLFNVNDLAKVGFTAGAHSSSVTGSIPFIGTGGSVKYIRLHDTPA